MFLTKHETGSGTRWAYDGRYLAMGTTLGALLGLPRQEFLERVRMAPTAQTADDPLVAPLDHDHEVWAAGVTYLRSRDARSAESSVGDVYDRVYTAERPELFFKSLGWRVSAPGGSIGVRSDSAWNVPEPELVLVVNRSLQIVGYTIGNDVSSRAIEGENPLYLPQAKTYDRSCSLGPRIWVPDSPVVAPLTIEMTIERGQEMAFSGSTATDQMRRGMDDLVRALGAELAFPRGVFLMTGTGIVPPDAFTLHGDDRVSIRIEPIGTLTNCVG